MKTEIDVKNTENNNDSSTIIFFNIVTINIEMEKYKQIIKMKGNTEVINGSNNSKIETKNVNEYLPVQLLYQNDCASQKPRELSFPAVQ
jgi:hypothetical protein